MTATTNARNRECKERLAKGMQRMEGRRPERGPHFACDRKEKEATERVPDGSDGEKCSSKAAGGSWVALACKDSVHWQT